MNWPVFALIRRELIAQLRRGKTLLMLMLLLCPLMAFCLLIWPGRHTGWSEIGMISRGYVSLVFGFMFAGAALFMPGIAATSIVLEREQRTWDMLYLSGLTPWGIVLGKFLSVVGLYIMMMIAAMPVLYSVMFMVGVDMTQILLALYIVMLTLMTCAALGMLSSAYCRTTTRAISRGYSFMLLNMGLAYMFGALLYGLLSLLVINDTVENVIEATFVNAVGEYSSAFMTVTMMYRVLMDGYVPGMLTVDLVVVHTLVQLTVTVVSLVLVRRRISRPERPQVVKKRAGRSAVTAGGIALPPGFKPVPDRMNPVLFREIHWGLALNRRSYITYFALMVAVAGILGFLNVEVDFPIPEALMTVVYLNLMLMSLMVTSNMAGAFTKEDDLKNHDMLKMTLVTPRQVVHGKIRGGLRIVNRLCLSSFVVCAVFLIPGVFDHNIYGSTYGESVCAYFVGHWMIWICGVFCVVLAAIGSILSKRTTTGIMASYSFVLMLYFGLAVFVQMMYGAWVMAFGWVSGISEEYIWATSPVAVYTQLMDLDTMVRWQDEAFWVTVLYLGVIALLYVTAIMLYRIRIRRPRVLHRQ